MADTGADVVELSGGWTLGRKPLGADKAIWTHALLHPNGVTFSRIGDDEASMLRDLAARLAAAEARAEALAGALTSVEWVHFPCDNEDDCDCAYADPVCPWCKETKNTGGHYEKCRLAAALTPEVRALARPAPQEGGGA